MIPYLFVHEWLGNYWTALRPLDTDVKIFPSLRNKKIYEKNGYKSWYHDLLSPRRSLKWMIQDRDINPIQLWVTGSIQISKNFREDETHEVALKVSSEQRHLRQDDDMKKGPEANQSLIWKPCKWSGYYFWSICQWLRNKDLNKEAKPIHPNRPALQGQEIRSSTCTQYYYADCQLSVLGNRLLWQKKKMELSFCKWHLKYQQVY